MIEFGKPKKLLCEMSETARNKFVKNIRGRKPLLLKYKGETRSMIEWAALYGVRLWTLKQRVKRGWSEDDLFLPTRNVRSSEQVAQDNLSLRMSRLRKKQEQITHKHAVNMAIIKVLKMRERRSRRVDEILNYQESVHYAISRVLEMRRNRAKRGRYSLAMVA